MSPPALPFAHLNLRYNPFGELDRSQWAEAVVPDLDLEPLARQLRQGAMVAQFIGRCGRGKSSHLMALRRYVPDAPYLYFPEGETLPSSFPEGPVVFLDETQRIPRGMRRQLFRQIRERGHSLVVGTHRNHAREARAAGLGFTSHRVRDLSEAKLLAVCERRIALAARRPPHAPEPPLPWVGRDAVRHLLRRHGDNLRAIGDELYEAFQGLDRVGELGVRHVQGG